MGKVVRVAGRVGVALCMVLSGCVPVATGGGDPGRESAGPPTADAAGAAPGGGVSPARVEVGPPPPSPGPQGGAGAAPGPAAVQTPSAAAGGGAGTSGDGTPVCTPTPAQEIVDAVNRIRRGAGLHPLQVDARLVEAARSHTEDMARRNRLGHDGSDGREVQHRAEALGYDWLLIAENVASGQPTVADVMGSWMNSPGHRRNILSPDTRHMGAAARASPGGRMYWTQVFGNTELRVPPTGGCHP